MAWAKWGRSIGIVLWMSAFAYAELRDSSLGPRLGLPSLQSESFRLMLGHGMFTTPVGTEFELYYTDPGDQTLYQASRTPILGGGELTLLQGIWSRPDYLNYFCRKQGPKVPRIRIYRYRLDGLNDQPSFLNTFSCEASWIPDAS